MNDEELKTQFNASVEYYITNMIREHTFYDTPSIETIGGIPNAEGKSGKIILIIGQSIPEAIGDPVLYRDIMAEHPEGIIYYIITHNQKDIDPDHHKFIYYLLFSKDIDQLLAWRVFDVHVTSIRHKENVQIVELKETRADLKDNLSLLYRVNPFYQQCMDQNKNSDEVQTDIKNSPLNSDRSNDSVRHI